MPLDEVLFDFYDRLKSITRGYGSFDYELLDYRPSDIVKVDILVNGEKVDALSYLVHREKARARALHYCERLAETIPRHQFKIAIQGAIGGNIIARTNINPFRKDVTAKCYGGDISRKRKLLEKQKEGKKRMKTSAREDPPGGLRRGAADRRRGRRLRDLHALNAGKVRRQAARGSRAIYDTGKGGRKLDDGAISCPLLRNQ